MGYYDGRDMPVLLERRRPVRAVRPLLQLGGRAAACENHVYWVAAERRRRRQSGDEHAGYDSPDDLRPPAQAGVSWKFYVQNYDPSVTYRTGATRGPEQGLAGRRGARCSTSRGSSTTRRFARTSSISTSTTATSRKRHAARGRLHRRRPARASIRRASLRPDSASCAASPSSLMASSAWPTSAFMWHLRRLGRLVRPRRPAEGRRRHGYGFRVPALLVSPYARRHVVDHTRLDYTSMLKFIEDNWTIQPLSHRDATAGSITAAFDFAQPPRPAAIIPLDRPTPSEPARPARDAVLYSLYGAGTLVAVALVLFVVLIGRPRKRLRRARSASRDDGAAVRRTELPSRRWPCSCSRLSLRPGRHAPCSRAATLTVQTSRASRACPCCSTGRAFLTDAAGTCPASRPSPGRTACDLVARPWSGRSERTVHGLARQQGAGVASRDAATGRDARAGRL